MGFCKRMKTVEHVQVEKLVTSFFVNGTNLAFVQNRDGRKDQGKANEIINLEGDDVEGNNGKKQIANTKKKKKME